MGDTARGTFTSKELGAFINDQKRAKYQRQAAEFVATINAKATSDFGDEIAADPTFGNMTQEQQAIAQMFFVLGYVKGSLTTSLELNKLIDKTIKETQKQ